MGSAVNPGVSVDMIEGRRTPPRARSLDDLVGLDEVKAELRAQIRLWADPAGLAPLGGTPRSGLLFLGPTGTGKTTAANALAAETGRPLYAFAGPDFHDEAGKDLLATVLSVTARQAAVVFIDEADDLVHVRDSQRELSESLVKYLLVGLDRTARDISAFFVLATNLEADEVDPALCHPGRLGRPVTFRTLDSRERLDLLESLAPRYALHEDARLAVLAAQLDRVPTVTVANALDEAAFVAWRRGSHRIEDVDLQEAADRLTAGIRRARPMSPLEVRAAAVHEAGHAIAAVVLHGRWDAVLRVSVMARAEGQLGTLTLAPRDDDLRTDADVHRELAVRLAGREADRLLLGVVDTGSSRDLEVANKLARHAAADWGLSERGPRTAGEYVEAIVEAHVDRAVGTLLAQAEATARDLLVAHRDAVEALAEHLAEHRAAGPGELATWLSALLPVVDGLEWSR